MALVAAAVLLGGAPAVAAPPAVVDGFTATGVAGSQVRVRLTKDLAFPYLDAPGVSSSASRGALAGFALVPLRGVGPMAYTIETTPQWTCGRPSCGSDRLRYSISWTGRLLEKGDYVLVLLGDPSATIHVTLAPKAKNARPLRIRTTHRATPVVTPTETTATGSGTDPVAFGTFTPPGSTARRAIYGVVHSITTQLVPAVEYSFDAGAPTTLGGCAGVTLDGRHSGRGPVSTWYSTQSMLTFGTPFGDRCASWEAQTRAPLSSHRGLGVFVPVVL